MAEAQQFMHAQVLFHTEIILVQGDEIPPGDL